ncbi:MAG: hypothetical protein IGQ45_09500 [Cyanobacterium sp. T60_A2020_053]|nr:hypothetical protein [Cyanobacterium sp. T60_A2020_053]
MSAMNKFVGNVTSLTGYGLFYLLKISPLLLIVFIGFGDKFLPTPFKETSFNTRSAITNVLSAEKKPDHLKNTKYNNKRTDQIVDELSK